MSRTETGRTGKTAASAACDAWLRTTHARCLIEVPITQAAFERARLRQRAETYGLAYWPALYVRGCDPRAYVIAERILARRAGALWGERLPDGSISHFGRPTGPPPTSAGQPDPHPLRQASRTPPSNRGEEPT